MLRPRWTNIVVGRKIASGQAKGWSSGRRCCRRPCAHNPCSVQAIHGTILRSSSAIVLETTPGRRQGQHNHEAMKMSQQRKSHKHSSSLQQTTATSRHWQTLCHRCRVALLSRRPHRKHGKVEAGVTKNNAGCGITHPIRQTQAR